MMMLLWLSIAGGQALANHYSVCVQGYCHSSTYDPGAVPAIREYFEGLDSIDEDRPFDDFQSRARTYHTLLNHNADLVTHEKSLIQARAEETLRQLEKNLEDLSQPLTSSWSGKEVPPHLYSQALDYQVAGRIDQAQQLIQLSSVRRQLTQASLQFLTDRVDLSRQFLEQSRLEPLPTIQNLALSTSRMLIDPVLGFLKGLATGTIQGFHELAETVAYVVNHPLNSAVLLKDQLVTILKDPEKFVNQGMSAIVSYLAVLAHGSVDEKGKAIGRLVPDLILALASEGVLSSGRTALRAALEKGTREKVFDGVGKAVLSALERQQYAAAAIQDARKVVPKLFGRSEVGKLHNHYLQKGPLFDEDVMNFLGGRYWDIKPRSGEMFYRVSENASGEWWAREVPKSEIQLRIDKAILPDWNATPHTYWKLTIPEGRLGAKFYEGLVGPQGGRRSAISRRGASNIYIGGTGQVYIDDPASFRKWMEKFNLGEDT